MGDSRVERDTPAATWTAGGDIRVELLAGREEIEAFVPELIAVYRAAFCAPPYDEGEEDVRHFRDEQLPRHLCRDGLRFAVARRGDRVVGFAYGYTGERGQPWADYVASVVAPELAAEWVGGHFELVEVAVVPHEQGRGVGGAFHDAVLRDLPHRRALLATWREEYPGWHLYHSRGWVVLEPALSETSCLMGLRLPRPQRRS